jgi:mannitol-1-/sugar-/sorbitol-6-/2-deoxyglucose-6-phosphatase
VYSVWDFKAAGHTTETNIFAYMRYNTVIFDMDGLLIDSEPLWNEAADEVFRQYGLHLTPEQHASTMGMRTREFVQIWFNRYKIPAEYIAQADASILKTVTGKVLAKGKPMPGIEHIFNYFLQKNFKIGLASSSDMQLINVVVDKLGIRPYLQSICSAAQLEFGKPHPQVYINCARELQAEPVHCLCFEDSFNGMIAAKAARMTCIVVPSPSDSKLAKFNAADLKISSLQNFNDLLLNTLG